MLLMNSWIEFAIIIRNLYLTINFDIKIYQTIQRFHWQKFSESCKTECCTDSKGRLTGKYGSLVAFSCVLCHISKYMRMIVMSLPFRFRCDLKFRLFHSYAPQYIFHCVRERCKADNNDEIGQRAMQWALLSLQLISYQGRDFGCS